MDDIEQLVTEAGFPDHRLIAGSDVIVGQWVRLKCTYTCEEYGRLACCPPSAPSVATCREFFQEYERVLVIHLQKAGDGDQEISRWKRELNAKLLELERTLFLAGFYKAMVLFAGSCSLCTECASTGPDCHKPGSRRPTPEALGVDVFATARKLGYPIEVLTDRSQVMNRYAFLLVE